MLRWNNLTNQTTMAKTNNDPAILLYPDDLIGGTYYFTDKQFRQYLMLLFKQHAHWSITMDDINEICNDPDPVIMKKFIKEPDGTFFNQRLRTEMEKRNGYIESRRKNRAGKSKPSEIGDDTDNESDKKTPDIICATCDNHMSNICSTCLNHMFFIKKHMGNGNGNGNIIGNEIGNENEKKVSEKLIDSIPLVTDLKPEKSDFIDGIVRVFAESFEYSRGLTYAISRGKDRAAAGKLATIFRKENPDATSEDAINELRSFFVMCMNINDGWLHDHMTLPLVVSKINEIRNILKNGQFKTNRGAKSIDIANVVGKHFGIKK